MQNNFNEKNYISQIQQKRLPKAQARLTETLLNAIENELCLICFILCFVLAFLLDDPSFLHCRVARVKVRGVLKNPQGPNREAFWLFSVLLFGIY